MKTHRRGVYDLTPLESRVLELRKAGLTLPQVGEVLNRKPQNIAKAMSTAREKERVRIAFESLVGSLRNHGEMMSLRKAHGYICKIR